MIYIFKLLLTDRYIRMKVEQTENPQLKNYFETKCEAKFCLCDKKMAFFKRNFIQIISLKNWIVFLSLWIEAALRWPKVKSISEFLDVNNKSKMIINALYNDNCSDWLDHHKRINFTGNDQIFEVFMFELFPL